MEDMNAKQLFGKDKITEAGPGERPPGRTGPPRRPVGRPMPSGGMDDPSAMMGMGSMGPGEDPVRRMSGREGPKAQFDENEISQIKDVMIQILAKVIGSDLDAQIGRSLMSGQPLEPGQLQHILDEARQIELPETHNALMQKLFTTLRSPQP